VEVRNTPGRSHVSDRNTETLLEDLCIALRDVAVAEWDLPDGPRVVSQINDVKTIIEEIAKRGVDCTARIATLCKETGWQVDLLLTECVSFPQTVPWVRRLDGVRRRFQCVVCHKAEYPNGTEILLCDGCVDRALLAIEGKTDSPGLFIYRTYTPSGRCRHADDETVLMTVEYDEFEFYGVGRCAVCLREEIGRRTPVSLRA
jgi:hypothetical protein